MKEIIKSSWFLTTFILLLIKRWVEFRIFATSRVTILLFHDVSNEQQVKFTNLISTLRYFGRFISLEEFETYSQQKEQIKGPLFLVTFDDGFVSSGEFTKKYLNPMGIKATFFICPGFVGRQKDDSDHFIVNNLFLGDYNPKNITSYQTPMNKLEIQSLIKEGHAIGSHSFNHKKLSSTNNETELVHEIQGSKAALECDFGVKVTSFAYPFGDIGSISNNALSIIHKNYSLNFTGIRGDFHPGSSSPLGIWRQSINLNDSPSYCLFCALGGLDPFYKRVQKEYTALMS